MESQTHFSKRLHELFLERFKGKITCINKEGRLGETSRSTVPIEKTPRKSTEICTFQQTPQPRKDAFDRSKRNNSYDIARVWPSFQPPTSSIMCDVPRNPFSVASIPNHAWQGHYAQPSCNWPGHSRCAGAGKEQEGRRNDRLCAKKADSQTVLAEIIQEFQERGARGGKPGPN